MSLLVLDRWQRIFTSSVTAAAVLLSLLLPNPSTVRPPIVKGMSGRGGESKRGRGRGRGRGVREGRGRGQADEYEPERLVPRKRGLFSRDLSEMMHGFGDGKPPFSESVEHVEEMCVDYITAIMQKATELATSRDVKVSTEDIMFVVRKDTKKFERAKEMLQKDKEIKAAKKDMDFDERTLAKEEGD